VILRQAFINFFYFSRFLSWFLTRFFFRSSLLLRSLFYSLNWSLFVFFRLYTWFFYHTFLDNIRPVLFIMILLRKCIILLIFDLRFRVNTSFCIFLHCTSSFIWRIFFHLLWLYRVEFFELKLWLNLVLIVNLIFTRFDNTLFAKIYLLSLRLNVHNLRWLLLQFYLELHNFFFVLFYFFRVVFKTWNKRLISFFIVLSEVNYLTIQCID